MNVRLTIDHSYVGDLTAYLVSPAGTRVQLLGSAVGQGANFDDTLFDDEAGQSITDGIAPFNDPNGYRPASPLDAFALENPNGLWMLQIIDGQPLDVGQLVRWQIVLTHGDPAVVTDPDGAYAFQRVPPGVWAVRVLSPPEWTYVAPEEGVRMVNVLTSDDKTGEDFGLIDVIPTEPREIRAPHAVLIPNRPDQAVAIFAEGTAPAIGIVLRAQIGDGRGVASEPVFSGVDYSGGIWDAFGHMTFGGVLHDAPQLYDGAVEFLDPSDPITTAGLSGQAACRYDWLHRRDVRSETGRNGTRCGFRGDWFAGGGAQWHDPDCGSR